MLRPVTEACAFCRKPEACAFGRKNHAIIGDSPTIQPGDGLAWEVFCTGEAQIHGNLREIPETVDPETPIRSEMILPLGEHGVFMASSTEIDDFDDEDVALARVLAANVETALDRAERAAALERRTRDLQRQNERLDEFASALSHDLRNPLTVAEGHLDLARAECDSDHFDVVSDAHERMSAMIDDLLKLAREGEAVEAMEPADLASLVDNCWRNVPTAESTLVVDTDRAIRADESRLQQALENLLRNAVEHGGEDVTVTVGDLDDGTGFFVADDGPGIPAGEANTVSPARATASDAVEGRERVFESGFSTTDAGTGFGLSIVKEIVDAHDWSIRVTESKDGGARFEIVDVEIAVR